MPDAVQLDLIDNRAVVRLKSWEPSAASNGLGSSFLSSLVPPGLGGQVRVLCLAPTERLVVSDAIAPTQLFDRLHRQLEGQSIAAVDLSCSLKTVRLSGSAAADLLTKGCGLDLYPNSFPAARSTRTRFAQLPLILDCVDPQPVFDLYVNRSYLPYLKAWLADAAVDSEAHTREALRR